MLVVKLSAPTVNVCSSQQLSHLVGMLLPKEWSVSQVVVGETVHLYAPGIHFGPRIEGGGPGHKDPIGLQANDI